MHDFIVSYCRECFYPFLLLRTNQSCFLIDSFAKCSPASGVNWDVARCDFPRSVNSLCCQCCKEFLENNRCWNHSLCRDLSLTANLLKSNTYKTTSAKRNVCNLPCDRSLSLMWKTVEIDSFFAFLSFLENRVFSSGVLTNCRDWHMFRIPIVLSGRTKFSTSALSLPLSNVARKRKTQSAGHCQD